MQGTGRRSLTGRLSAAIISVVNLLASRSRWPLSLGAAVNTPNYVIEQLTVAANLERIKQLAARVTEQEQEIEQFRLEMDEIKPLVVDNQK
jgi:hypothetical protein